MGPFGRPSVRNIRKSTDRGNYDRTYRLRRTAGLPAVSDPCLQVADYCSWVVSRKWEQGKDDAFKMLASKVHSEFDVFAVGKTHYY